METLENLIKQFEKLNSTYQQLLKEQNQIANKVANNEKDIKEINQRINVLLQYLEQQNPE